jgi:hypothetical protein
MTTFIEALDYALDMALTCGHPAEELKLYIGRNARWELSMFYLTYYNTTVIDRYFGVRVVDHPFIPNAAILRTEHLDGVPGGWRAVIEGRPE